LQNLDSSPDKHPQFDKLAKIKNPTAASEIPKKLFLSWSMLRRKQDELAIPASSFMELLQNSRNQYYHFTIFKSGETA